MTTLDEFIEDLRRQLEDEKAAFTKYQSLATVADGLGHSSVGATLRNISEDEQKHFQLLGQMVKRLSWVPEFAELRRPFPQTYDDWADLGIDIGAKDPSIADEVQDMLTRIYVGGPAADDAKKWLVKMAGELGIT